MVTVCPSQFATRRTLFHVLVGCGLLMLKVSRLKLPVRSEERRVGKECRSRWSAYDEKKKAVGGIQLQILHGRTGILVRSIEGTSVQVLKLLDNAAIRKLLQQAD